MAVERTSEELQSPKFNYYIALELSANEKNPAVIQKAIADKIVGQSDDNAYGERLKALVNNITEIMVNDPAARKLEAEAATKFKLDEAVELVKSIAVTNGIMYKSALRTICNNANKPAAYFNFADLEKAFLACVPSGTVKYIDDSAGGGMPLKEFDVCSDMLQSSLRMSSLYEFLGISPTASVSEITAKKDAKYSEYMNKGARDQKTLGKDLCSYVETFLTLKPETRKYYDYYVKTKSEVWRPLYMRSSFGAKSVTINEYYGFAQILMDTLKLNVDDVEVLLGNALKTYGLVISGGENTQAAKGGLGLRDLEICPYPDCGKIYESGAKICPHCGKPLEILCWNCGSKMPFTLKSKTCGTCGATVQSKEQFVKQTAQIDRLIASPDCDISAIDMALTAMKNIVVNYKNFPNSVLFKKAGEYEKEIARRRQLEETAGKQFREAVDEVKKFFAEKNYVQAKNAAENLKRKFPGYRQEDSAKLVADADEGIRRAQAQLQDARAKISSGNEEAAVSSALRALDICADYYEAKQFIAKYPPKPPVSMRAELSHETAKLSWQAPAAHANITYSLIRKVGSAPSGCEDGTLIASGLSMEFFEDKNVSSATSYYYGVYSERGGVRSVIATHSAPVIFFGDVANVRQEMVEGAVKVKWDAPENVSKIEVWKKKGSVPPQGANDGELLAGCGQEGFTDPNTGTETSYLILCKYEVNGAVRYSKGVSRTFKAIQILHAPGRVKIRQMTPCEFVAEAEVKAGNLRFLFAGEKLSCRTDTLLQAASYTEAVKGSSELKIGYTGQEMSFTLPPDTVGWIYPVVYNDQLFLVGQPIAVNSICGIRNLNYTDQGSGGMLTGTLQSRVCAVIVKLSERGFITEYSEAGDTVKVSAEEFNRQGGIKLSLKRNVTYYISVFTEVEFNGKKFISMVETLDSTICQRDKIAVKFCFEFTPTPMKPFKLTVKFAADSEVDLPEFVIMRGAPKPISKNNGELVEKLPKAVLKKGLFGKEYTYKVTITAPPMPRGMSFSLFPSSDQVSYLQMKEVLKL